MTDSMQSGAVAEDTSKTVDRNNSDPGRGGKRHYNSTSAGKGRWKLRFLTALAQIPNVGWACQTAHVCRKAAYRARKADKVFAAKWVTALQVGLEGLESSLWERSTHGYDEDVWLKDADGNPVCVGQKKKFSDVGAIFLLKAHDPVKYRETTNVNMTQDAAEHGVLVVPSTGQTEAQWEAEQRGGTN